MDVDVLIRKLYELAAGPADYGYSTMRSAASALEHLQRELAECARQCAAYRNDIQSFAEDIAVKDGQLAERGRQIAALRDALQRLVTADHGAKACGQKQSIAQKTALKNADAALTPIEAEGKTI